MDWLWFVALVITHCVAYHWGYANGEEERISDDQELELRKYAYDKFYEYKRWEAERADKDA